MEFSAELLKKGEQVSAAALEVGYSSLPTFCRRFKSHFGLTPKEYQLGNRTSSTFGKAYEFRI